MVKSSLTASLARQDMARVRSPRQYTVACSPTNEARSAEALPAQRPPQLVLVPASDAPIVRKAQPSEDALPTAGRWATDPQSGLLGGLLSLLASEPEPDKLPANLMLEVAEQIGADDAYLFRTDAATQTLALAPWVIIDGAIRHRDTVPALLPLARASAMISPPAPQVARYTLRNDRHPYLGTTSIARFRLQGYRVGLTLPLLAGGQLLGFLELMARADAAFLPAQIDRARALAEQLSLAAQCARMTEHAARAAALEERQRLAREIHDTLGRPSPPS